MSTYRPGPGVSVVGRWPNGGAPGGGTNGAPGGRPALAREAPRTVLEHALFVVECEVNHRYRPSERCR